MLYANPKLPDWSDVADNNIALSHTPVTSLAFDEWTAAGSTSRPSVRREGNTLKRSRPEPGSSDTKPLIARNKRGRPSNRISLAHRSGRATRRTSSATISSPTRGPRSPLASFSQRVPATKFDKAKARHIKPTPSGRTYTPCGILSPQALFGYILSRDPYPPND